MGKKKKGYNWQAREQPGGQLDTAELASLQGIITIPGIRSDTAQGTNVIGEFEAGGVFQPAFYWPNYDGTYFFFRPKLHFKISCV
jgi:hypothetical protein